LLRGYFGDISVDALTGICFDGLLIHDFGGDIAALRVGDPGGFYRLDDLRDKLRERIVKNHDARTARTGEGL